MNNFPIDQVIASPLKRTRQTADQIAKQLKLKYTTDNLLIERMIWNNQSISRTEFLKEWAKASNNRHYVPKWGDSSFKIGQRIDKFIQNIKFSNNNHIVLVTHGGAILDYLRNIFGDAAVKDLACMYESGLDYQMLHCSINSVEINHKPKLIRLNYSDHLSELTE